ncbi:MAG TPA: DNA gyrase subunit B [Psychromonas hadalis]|nr:DNA gyrase subunit B [Psychromonas hadalis]
MKPLTLLSALLLLAYPLAVYYGLSRWRMGAVAGILVLLFALRILGSNQTRLLELKKIAWISGLAGIALTLAAFIFNNSQWFTYYPLVVNAVMFTVFFSSLWQKESMVERFARLQDPNLPDHAIGYTRTVTKVWCVFFIINGAISFASSLISMEVWTLYNGLLSYLLAGGLFAIEFIVRLIVQKKHVENDKINSEK